MKEVFLYGILDAANMYRAVLYRFIKETEGESIDIIEEIKAHARSMKESYPSIEEIYAISNHYGLKDDYRRSLTAKTAEDCIIFKDILERYGLRVL